MSITFHGAKSAFRSSQAGKIRIWLERIIHDRGFTIDAISIIFCTDEYLLDINKQYLNHDYYTDIITFPYQEEGVKELSGDIFISTDRVKENADTYKVTFFQELCRVMAHGCLHLMGWDDETEAQKTAMRAEEDRCLALIDF